LRANFSSAKSYSIDLDIFNRQNGDSQSMDSELLQTVQLSNILDFKTFISFGIMSVVIFIVVQETCF